MLGPRGASKKSGSTAGGVTGVSKPGIVYSLRSGKRVLGSKGEELNTGGNFPEQGTYIRRNDRRSGKVVPSLKGGTLLNKERRINPSLKTYFTVLPSTLSMEGSEPGQGAVLGNGVTQIGRIQCDPNMFQVLEELHVNELDASGSSGGEGAVVHRTNGVHKDGVQLSDINDEQEPRGVNQQLGLALGHQLVDQGCGPHLRIPPRGTEGHQWGSAEEPLEQSITGMLTALSLEVRAGFETSNANQKEIRGLCETLGRKIGELAGRTAALEEEVGDLRLALEKSKVPGSSEGGPVRLCQLEIRVVLDKSL
ncbi:hypothetical protein NDU88_002872 [Pleurodeles waltl]|uniref:Uncharacterized protein n=1 Tax=Pleurodeles waltl TaxID=8319 RepID=A0AAV7W4D7_PLEWA|nr:hypothetical protein NDU88_002872 [Pleurodeles waltl]